MAKFILAYILIIVFFLLEIFIRRGATAKSIDKTQFDNKSTYLIGLTFFVVLILSLVLNFFKIGVFKNQSLAISGLMLMSLGLVIRVYSMLTLKKYYTRTLILTADHSLFRKGLYKFIRHPGYLGTILIWCSCGLAMENGIIFIAALILISVAYFFRINNEEKMLMSQFGNEYLDYKKSSWRLIPFIW